MNNRRHQVCVCHRCVCVCVCVCCVCVCVCAIDVCVHASTTEREGQIPGAQAFMRPMARV